MFISTVFWSLYSIAYSSQIKVEVEPAVSVLQSGENSVLYDGAQVWKVEHRRSEDVKLFQDLMDKEEVSMWMMTPQQSLFLVKIDNKLKIHSQLRSAGLNHTVVITDVQRTVDEQKVEPDNWDQNTLRLGHRMNWNKYPTLDIVHEYLNHLTKVHHSVCKQRDIGKSVEGVPIKMLTISNGNPKNKGILLVSGAHAREWLAITSALYILRELVSQFNSQTGYIIDKDWHVIPVLNPDGFRYSYQHDRLWRKNRGSNYLSNSNCKGVDLNRNFDIGWDMAGRKGKEENVCSETFAGQRPFSEPETIALRNIVQSLKSRVVAIVDFHSFGQQILYPWSSKACSPDDERLLNATSEAMRSAILELKGNKHWTAGQAYHEVYFAPGSLIDWVYSVGIRHSYAIEGPDRGQYGFLMPPTYIEGVGREMLIAVTRLARVIDRRH